jgi:osmotically-inducible protein OsmY
MIAQCSEYLERVDTAMQIRTDDSIRDDVLFELKWDPKIESSSNVAVAVKDGVVAFRVRPKLLGKDAAGKAAKRVYGVRGVPNGIEVKPTTVRTDPEIAREVIQSLFNHSR